MAAIIYVFYSFFFDPTQEKALIAIAVLIIFDFITGFWSAKVSGEEIKSGKVFRSATKSVIYFLFISAAHIAGVAFPFIKDISGSTVIAFLALTELISIMENIGKMGFAIPKKMLNKLQDIRDDK
jgi:toxin secretion/phage lysis holin